MDEINSSNCDCPCARIDPNVTNAGWKELASIWPSSEQFDAATRMNEINGKPKMNGGRRTRRLKGGAMSLTKSVILDEPHKARIIRILQDARYISHLGDGGFGSVDLVQLNARTFAVRKRMTYPINDCRMNTLVEREIAVMADLTRNASTREYVPNFIGALYYNHNPHLIKRIFCCKRAVTKTVEIYMYYIRGNSLFDICRLAAERPGFAQLQIPFMTDLIPKLLTAIQQIHAARYVHCDVKPENIFITEDDNPIFIDFGGTVRIGEPFDLGTADFLPREYAEAALHPGRVKLPAIPEIDLYGLEKSIYSALFILRSFVHGQGRYQHPNNQYIASAYSELARTRFPGRGQPPANYQWQNIVLPAWVGQTIRRFDAPGPNAAFAGAAPGPNAAFAGAAPGPNAARPNGLRQRRKSKV